MSEPIYRVKWIQRSGRGGRIHGSHFFTSPIPRGIFPIDGGQGKWSPRILRPALCRRGWHVCGNTPESILTNHPPDGSLRYGYQAELWIVEVRGQCSCIHHVTEADKEAWEQIRGIQRLRIGLRGPTNGCISQWESNT
jgi:hypothetical protein